MQVVSKNSCSTSQFCILNHNVPVFAKNASYILDYFIASLLAKQAFLSPQNTESAQYDSSGTGGYQL